MPENVRCLKRELDKMNDRQKRKERDMNDMQINLQGVHTNL